MSPQSTRRERRRSLRSVYVWHRWLGVASALIVLMLAITGILLNHSHDFGLDRRFVRSGWLLDWYGIRGTAPTRGYKADNHWISVSDGELFLDAQPLAALDSPLQAGLECGGLIIAAGRNTLLLVSPDGELVERLDAESLPGLIRSAACDVNGIILDTERGHFQGTTELLEWKVYSGKPAPSTATDQPLPGTTAVKIAEAGRARSLNWERVMADLHSGRIFGHIGTLAMDFAAIGFMVLSLSGLWLWARHLRTQRQRLHHRGH